MILERTLHIAPIAHYHAAPPSGSPPSLAARKILSTSAADAASPRRPITDVNAATIYESGVTPSLARSIATLRAKCGSLVPVAALHAAVKTAFGNLWGEAIGQSNVLPVKR